MKVIRASEIGSWLYCGRAWWYQHQGVASSNQAGMQAGTSSHRHHGQHLFTSALMRLLGWLTLLIGLALLVSYAISTP